MFSCEKSLCEVCVRLKKRSLFQESFEDILSQRSRLFFEFENIPGSSKHATVCVLRPEQSCHLAFKIPDSVLTPVRKNVSLRQVPTAHEEKFAWPSVFKSVLLLCSVSVTTGQREIALQKIRAPEKPKTSSQEALNKKIKLNERQKNALPTCLCLSVTSKSRQFSCALRQVPYRDAMTYTVLPHQEECRQ